MNPRFFQLLFAVMALVAAALPVHVDARADEPADAPADALVLDAAQGTIDAWPALRVLADPTHELGLADMLRRRDAFEAPTVPRNNFGMRTEALWLRLPLVVRGAGRRWVLELDYPPLNRIDAWLLEDGRVVKQVAMGNTLAAAARPIRGRSHAADLEFAGAGRYELYLRVVSTSTLVVPVRLHEPDQYVRQESLRMLVQGVGYGLALMLLASSLIHAFALRDLLFLYYAAMLVGVTTFFVSFSGVGHAFLWSAQVGLLARISPWSTLLALSAACLFVVEALQMRRLRPRLAHVLDGLAALGVLAILLSLAGWLDYRATQIAPTVLGPVLLLLAVHESLRQARAGNRSARYLLFGWAAYTVGALSMSGQLRGWLPVDFWTQHLFQFSSMLEMLAWMQVLALRVEDIRRDAERSLVEHQALHSLAHTDALTGLPNRRGLDLALDAALPRAGGEAPLALYLLDLDGFKAVNDSLGHDGGDALLVQVGRRLRALLRASDIVARLGGDEFVVVSPGVAGEAAAFAVGRKMLDAFKEPFVVAGQPCRVGLTIGFALAPHDGTQAADLLRRADAAMYAGKQGGRHCIRRGGASIGLAGT